MLTSIFVSSFPSLIFLPLHEKHQQTPTQLTESNGLQARGEIRKHFGKYFSKHWLKHWGSGFLCIFEWRKCLWYTLLNDFPFFARVISFSHFNWSCGFANRCQACVELVFCPWCLNAPCAGPGHAPSQASHSLSCGTGMCWGTSPEWHRNQGTCPISKSTPDFFSGFCSVLQGVTSSGCVQDRPD